MISKIKLTQREILYTFSNEFFPKFFLFIHCQEDASQGNGLCRLDRHRRCRSSFSRYYVI
jgi:hypothetical protein